MQLKQTNRLCGKYLMHLKATSDRLRQRTGCYEGATIYFLIIIWKIRKMSFNEG